MDTNSTPLDIFGELAHHIPGTATQKVPAPILKAEIMLPTPLPPPTPSKLQSWLPVPNYEIKKTLGKGGMGAVYHAWDNVLRRDVVIKIPLAYDLSAATQYIAKLFLQEARAMAQVKHPNIVQIHVASVMNTDSPDWPDGILPYFVMEWINGESLDRICKKRLPFNEVLDIMQQVAEALRCLQQRGIAHRDVKPSNVLVITGSEQGGHTAMLADFGIAIARDFTRSTGQGGVIGTEGYRAPEQDKGLPDIDWRADMFAWARMFTELLLGWLPGYHQEQRMPKDHEHIPEAIAKLLSKMLSEEPADRVATWEEAIECLKAERLRWARECLASSAEKRYAEFQLQCQDSEHKTLQALLRRVVGDRKSGASENIGDDSPLHRNAKWVPLSRLENSCPAMKCLIAAFVRPSPSEDQNTKETAPAILKVRNDEANASLEEVTLNSDQLLIAWEKASDAAAANQEFYDQRECINLGFSHWQKTHSSLDLLSSKREIKAAHLAPRMEPEEFSQHHIAYLRHSIWRDRLRRFGLAAVFGVLAVTAFLGMESARRSALTAESKTEEAKQRKQDAENASKDARNEAERARLASAEANTQRQSAETEAAKSKAAQARAETERKRAEEAEGKATAEAQRAKSARDDAEELVAYLVDELKLELKGHVRLRLLGDIVERVGAYYDNISRDELNADQLRHICWALEMHGDLANEAGDRTLAEQDFTKALEAILESDKLLPNQAQTLEAIGGVKGRLGSIKVMEGNSTAAEQFYKEALEPTLRASKLDPSRREARRSLSALFVLTGRLKMEQQDFDAALGNFEKSLAIIKELTISDPKNFEWQEQLRKTWSDIGGALMAKSNVKGAKHAFQQSLAVAEEMVRIDPDNLHCKAGQAHSLDRLALVDNANGDYQLAIGRLEKAISLSLELLRVDSDRSDWKWDLALYYRALGCNWSDRGDLGEATKVGKKASDLLKDLVALDAENAAWLNDLFVSLSYESFYYYRLGADGAAKKLCSEAQKIGEELARANKLDAKNKSVLDEIRIGAEQFAR